VARYRRHGYTAEKTVRIRVAEATGFQSEPESEPIIGTRAISSGRLRHSPRRHTHANRATLGPQTRRQTQPPQQVVAIHCLRQRPLGALPPHTPPSLGALRRNRSQLRLPSSVSYLTNHSFPTFHHSTTTCFFDSALIQNCRTLSAPSSPRGSLQHVYALRERLPPSVVIDGSFFRVFFFFFFFFFFFSGFCFFRVFFFFFCLFVVISGDSFFCFCV